MPDKLTLMAISALAYVVAVALHEHLGHASACVLLGSHPTELGAFYVNCDDSRLSALGVRAVALAGPFVSVLTGIASFLVLPRLPSQASRAFYFTWLLGSIALMDAAGYAAFSGVAGIGDLGVGEGGALDGAAPQWLWRIALIAVGVVSYGQVMALSVRRIAPRVGGAGTARIRAARGIALISYLTGAAVYLAIGLLNPHGLLIVAVSALPASLGGTSGLLWMMLGLAREPPVPGSGLYFARSWGWIVVASVITLGYAVFLGPTSRP
jgi:hypothetical protein